MLTNYTIQKTDFKFADVGTILWQNTESSSALQVKISDAIFPGHDNTHKEALEESWRILAARAESNLPSGDTFKFYNSEILKWQRFDLNTNTIFVEKSMYYKDITAVRSQQAVYDQIPTAERPSAFVLMNILITADNKIVLGRRPYFGDWPHDRYECPGSFLKEKHVTKSSLEDVAKSRVWDDYQNQPPLETKPLLICDLPRVMETMLLYETHTTCTAQELQSDFYTNLLTVENSPAGFEHLQALPLDQFHPPSRVMLQAYFESIV